MKIKTLWVQTFENQYGPELLVSVNESSADKDHGYFFHQLVLAKERVGKDFKFVRVIEIEIPEEKFDAKLLSSSIYSLPETN